MLARDETAGVRQRPVEILVAANIDAALALDRHAQWTAVREARLVFDSKRQAHRQLLCDRLPRAIAHGIRTHTKALAQTAIRESGLGPIRRSFKPAQF